MRGASPASRWRGARLLVAATVAATVAGAVAALPAQAAAGASAGAGKVQSGRALRHDVSPPLRSMTPKHETHAFHEHEDRAVPAVTVTASDPVVQSTPATPNMPATSTSFEGIGFPGVNCNCLPPDTNGEAGATQYVQSVNDGFQVWDKSGASLYGPADIATLWAGFGGYCEVGGAGDPVVLYDQLAGRWVISQFAGTSTLINHECLAVSTTSDATGTYYRYDFNLGGNFYDYPKLSVWPDAYYLAENVFNSSGTAYLGPQPFALDRTRILAGLDATFVSPGLQSASLGFMLPADVDGSTPPPSGAPNPWLGTNGTAWPLYRFHADFATPANTTFTLGGTLAAAGFTSLCPFTRSCIPQPGTTAGLDGIGDRPMYRLAYRAFADGHEALVGNRTVSSAGIAGVRWFEINHATSGTPAFTQQGTYQPDGTNRWMGSAAMDRLGDLAVGFSVSSATVYPGIAYAGRLASDPPNTLAQGESTLIAGSGSQTSSYYRWGDYSDLVTDPVDDCTFWFTSEYYPATSVATWHTRIGSFRFPSCTVAPTLTGVSVAPATASVPKGTTTQLTATATYSDGSTTDVTNDATWSSDTPSVATVSDASGSKGLVTGVAEGAAAVTAAYGSMTGSSAVTVTPAQLTSIAVSPASASVAAGLTTQLTATGTYTDGSTADVTNDATWASDTPSVATVSDASGSKGLVTGVAQGAATVSASVGSVSGSSSVTVTAAVAQSLTVSPSSASVARRHTVQLTATLHYSDGSTADVSSTATWSSSNVRIAAVSSTGLVTGKKPGTVTITATASGFSGTSTVTVTRR